MSVQNTDELYLLVFNVRRIKKINWFQFWLANYAKIYGHVYGSNMEEVKEIVKKDMQKKGFEILKFTEANKFKDIGYPPETLSRIEKSHKHGAKYTFYGLSKSEIEKLEEKSGALPTKITSRYADIEGVNIDLDKLPKELHDVVEYAKMWAIGDDVERSKFISQVSIKEKKVFYRAVLSKANLIEKYCNNLRNETPVPDEVVLLDWMMESYAEILPSSEYDNNK